jgi:hypothetical protein
MNRQALPSFLLVSITCLVVMPTKCAVSAQIPPRQTTSASKARTHTPPLLKKYFPQRVGKFTLATANISDEESKSMRRSWVSLFGATEFARGIYFDHPEAQELSQAIEASVLLTVALFPSRRRADAAVASLVSALEGRGYAIERKRLGASKERLAGAEVTIATSPNADDWAVIWSRGSVVFQVQAAKKKEKALDFAHSFPY